jgi:REP element-mobilizing transposase RayT
MYNKCFVIMPNHFHLLWKISDGFERKDVQGAMFSFTAHEFKKNLKKSDLILLENHYVNKSDRSFLPIAIGMGKRTNGERMLDEEFF